MLMVLSPGIKSVFPETSTAASMSVAAALTVTSVVPTEKLTVPLLVTVFPLAKIEARLLSLDRATFTVNV